MWLSLWHFLCWLYPLADGFSYRGCFLIFTILTRLPWRGWRLWFLPAVATINRRKTAFSESVLSFNQRQEYSQCQGQSLCPNFLKLTLYYHKSAFPLLKCEDANFCKVLWKREAPLWVSGKHPCSVEKYGIWNRCDWKVTSKGILRCWWSFTKIL